LLWPFVVRMEVTHDSDGMWSDINKVLCRTSPLAEGFVPDKDCSGPAHKALEEPILVIGAGGLGCELLKDLSLMGFKNIEVIDMDSIDLSNLNRQFLFREKDVGAMKAEVAARFVNERVTEVKVIPHTCRIQEKNPDFYKKFKLIVCGLDNIDARRWMNSLVVSLVEETASGDPDISTLIPLVDGGTEGFKGHVRVIFPTVTACFECMLETFPPQITFPECTIANTPRSPQHCVSWAQRLAWRKEKPFGDKEINGDDEEHVQWLFEKATQRAAEFNITGVTFKLTKGVIKNIIPAIASTNAVVSAMCANEAFKIATECSLALDDFTMYNGGASGYSHTTTFEKKASCIVCGNSSTVLTRKGDTKLSEIITYLREYPDYQFKKPRFHETCHTP